jgi:hypothetical protein
MWSKHLIHLFMTEIQFALCKRLSVFHLGTAGAPEQSLKLVASLAKCLLGPRVQEFFLLDSAGYVGKKGPYPFAVLFLKATGGAEDKLIERAQRWPVAKQVAKTARVVSQRSPKPVHPILKWEERNQQWSTI